MDIRSNTLTADHSTARDPREELGRLLELAATDELEDETLAEIREHAIAITEHLAGRGLLPLHVTVEPNDPAIVLARTLVAVLRRLPSAPADRG